MYIPIDQTKVRFLMSGQPRARVEFETGVPKLDRATGEQLYDVTLVMMSEEECQTIVVKVVGRPEGLRPMTPVKVKNLRILPWSNAEKGIAGLAYAADSIEAEGKAA